MKWVFLIKWKCRWLTDYGGFSVIIVTVDAAYILLFNLFLFPTLKI